jgi:hypothetical protein
VGDLIADDDDEAGGALTGAGAPAVTLAPQEGQGRDPPGKSPLKSTAAPHEEQEEEEDDDIVRRIDCRSIDEAAFDRFPSRSQ